VADFESVILKSVRSGSDLTGRQIAVLLRCRDEPRTVRFLAEDLKISKPAISRAADKLADQGYLGRKDDPSDRRSVLLALTTVGRKFIVGLNS